MSFLLFVIVILIRFNHFPSWSFTSPGKRSESPDSVTQLSPCSGSCDTLRDSSGFDALPGSTLECLA